MRDVDPKHHKLMNICIVDLDTLSEQWNREKKKITKRRYNKKIWREQKKKNQVTTILRVLLICFLFSLSNFLLIQRTQYFD